MSKMIGDKLNASSYLRLADNGVTIEVSTDNTAWSGIAYAALSGAAFAGSVTIGGIALTPATQPTTAEKAAMTAANSPSAENAFATINDLDTSNLGWYATATALRTAHPTGSDGQHAIVGETDTTWIWDSDTGDWVDSDTKGQVTSVNGYTGTVVLVKSDVGLGNVDNTADADKPVSSAQQTALDGKVATSITINGHALTGNVTVTAADVGLGNVVNLLNNYAATAAPTATDDSAAGYAVGSRWIDTTADKAYTCVDVTASAAVWIEG